MTSGRNLFTETGREGAYSPWEWAPDGSAALYKFLPGDTDGCDWTKATPEFWLVDRTSGEARPVREIGALHVEWYGSHLVESGCERPVAGEPALNRWTDLRALCKDPASGAVPGEVFVGGLRVARWPVPSPPGGVNTIEPVGFLPK